MRAWLTDWKESVTQRKNKQAEAGTSPDLRTRFLVWYKGLPEVSRCRSYAMIEIEQALNTQGRYLSPILISEGWQRKRKWSSEGQYHRYWIPSTKSL